MQVNKTWEQQKFESFVGNIFTETTKRTNNNENRSWIIYLNMRDFCGNDCYIASHLGDTCTDFHNLFCNCNGGNLALIPETSILRHLSLKSSWMEHPQDWGDCCLQLGSLFGWICVVKFLNCMLCNYHHYIIISM
jgi:hypothetical protein